MATFALTSLPVRTCMIKNPKGADIKDRLAFLAWIDNLMLRLLELTDCENLVAWADYQGGRYVINLAVDVVFPGAETILSEGELIELQSGVLSND